MIPAPTLMETWTVRKPAVAAADGLVASQHQLASQAGARVLAQGGNAVDAAVAASLLIGTVEPWMSGLGGGGYLLYHEAATGRCHAVDFGMRSAAGLDPAAYALASGGFDDDLFGWPAVVEDRNVNGPLAMAVPGYLAGVATALERFGTRTLAQCLQPAIDSAEAGMVVDWFATLKIAAAAPVLARFGESARTYLPGGFAPAGEWGGPVPRIKLGRLAQTLRRIAQAGWEDFYRGDIAAAIVADARAAGSPLSEEDLRAYRPRVLAADACGYRGARVHTAPGLTAGPTLQRVLAHMESGFVPGDAPDAAAYMAYADALLAGYEHRLTKLGDADEARAPSCTTHLSVVDAQGNLVALTQTLLSVFGSKVMLPGTGILMNNGIMWFDPRPGRPNSIAPGKRPLSNMCPVVVERGDGLRFAAGASGGRRIMAAVMQMLSFLVDYRMSVDAAVHQPRIDVSGTPWVTCFQSLDADIVEHLATRHRVRREPNAVYPALYACPNVVARDERAGVSEGGAFIMSPWASVVAQ
jgi:gamma-glutamyltranspeptidase/glutathione hydrolase